MSTATFTASGNSNFKYSWVKYLSILCSAMHINEQNDLKQSELSKIFGISLLSFILIDLPWPCEREIVSGMSCAGNRVQKIVSAKSIVLLTVSNEQTCSVGRKLDCKNI